MLKGGENERVRCRMEDGDECRSEGIRRSASSLLHKWEGDERTGEFPEMIGDYAEGLGRAQGRYATKLGR